MAKICQPNKPQKNVLIKEDDTLKKCKFKLHFPPIESPRTFFAFKPLDFQNPFCKGRLGFQCHSEERKRKNEIRRKKIMQRLKKVYKINVEDINEHLQDAVISKVVKLEKEKKEREKKNAERAVNVIKKLLAEQKHKRRGIETYTPYWRRKVKTLENVCHPEEEEIQAEEQLGEIEDQILGDTCISPSEEMKQKQIYKCEEEPLQEESTTTDSLSECLKQVLPKELLPRLQDFKNYLRKRPKSVPVETSLESTPKRVTFKFNLLKNLKEYWRDFTLYVEQDYEKNKVYLQELRITNIGVEVIHFRYLGMAVQEKIEGRFPIGVAVRDNVKLRPGLSCCTKIRLCSENDSKEIECSVVFEARRQYKSTQHSCFLVPVVCIPSRAIIKVTPTKVIFPSLTWCAATAPESAKLYTKFIKIENSGGKKCYFRIAKGSVEICEEEEVYMEQEEQKEDEDDDDYPTTSFKAISSTTETDFSEIQELYGEDYSGVNEALETALLIIDEFIENVFETFRFSEKYFVEVPPFSVKEIELKFTPEYKGFHHEIVYMQFEDCYNLVEEAIEMIADIKKLPLRIEPQVIDLKTCIANSGVYAGVFKIFNESRGPYRVSVNIPASVRKYADIHPRTCIIQALNHCDISVRIYPRVSLFKDDCKYYNENSKILEFPVFIHPANVGSCKTDRIKIYVFALITTYILELSPAEIDFGVVSTLETVRAQILLTNHSLAVQEYAFLNLPKGVRVEPNMGFGKILPKEAITLFVLYSPGIDVIENSEGQGGHSFQIAVTSVAEHGGFREKLVPDKEEHEPEETKSFESIWGEGYDYVKQNAEQRSYFTESRESLTAEEPDDYTECFDEDSSIEEEQFISKVQEQETKIRGFLKQDRDEMSEHSFFKRMNVQEETNYKTENPENPLNETMESTQSTSNESEKGEDDSFGNETFRPDVHVIKCQALVIDPYCQMSETITQLPATPVSSFSLHRFWLHGWNETDCVCGVRSSKKSNGCEGKPKFDAAFEFQYFCPHIKFEPQSGFFKAGDNVPINVIFRPEFPAEDLRYESKVQKAKKIIKEKEAEREQALKRMVNSKLRQKSKFQNNKSMSEIFVGSDINEVINTALCELEKYDYFAGERSLQELINPFYVELKVHCFIKTLQCEGQNLRTECHDLIFICPAVKPNFIYLGDSQEINFGKVFIGSRQKIFLNVQNVSFERISPVISLLNPVGPFSCFAALKRVEVDPEHIWRPAITYAPTQVKGVEKEYFEIRSKSTNIFLTVQGEAVEPKYNISPNFACCELEAKMGSTDEIKLEIENLNSMILNLQFASDCVKEGIYSQKDELFEPLEELRVKSQIRDSKDKKKIKNFESEKKKMKIWEEIPDFVLDELQNFTNVSQKDSVATKVFSLIGLSNSNEVAIPPFAKFSVKIRFAPTIVNAQGDTTGEKRYAVKYKILLERISPLKEILVLGVVSKSNFGSKNSYV